jgi:hypothetical protein
MGKIYRLHCLPRLSDTGLTQTTNCYEGWYNVGTMQSKKFSPFEILGNSDDEMSHENMNQ